MPLSACVVLGLCSVLDIAVVAHPEEERVSLLQGARRLYPVPEDPSLPAATAAEATPSNDSDDPIHVITGEASKDHPTCVALYYTSYCPKTVDFVQYQLPALMEADSNMEMSFVPYGFQNDEGTTGRGCQHGEIECYSNAMHRCALRLLDNATQVRRCDAQSPYQRSQPLEASLFVKFLQCHSPAIWHRTQHEHNKTKDIIRQAARTCLSSLGVEEQRWLDILSCADDAWHQRSADEEFQLAGAATRVAASEFLPTFRVRCPGDAQPLQGGAVLPEAVADGNQKLYDFREWTQKLCHDGVWPPIGHDMAAQHHHQHDMSHM